jgi:uncharacterized protein
MTCIRLICIAVVLAAGFSAVAIAADGPAFDCAKAESSAEELVCSDAALSALDRDLADTYRAALAAAEGLDAGAEEASSTLKATQRGWIKGRDECWKADDLRTCVERAYLERTAELVVMWMLRAPYTEAAWRCGDTPANEAYVMYFDTELPAIRVEYGDGVAAMTATPTASGARYDGAFGRFFWERSGAALFAWEEGDEQSCELVAG